LAAQQQHGKAAMEPPAQRKTRGKEAMTTSASTSNRMLAALAPMPAVPPAGGAVVNVVGQVLRATRGASSSLSSSLPSASGAPPAMVFDLNTHLESVFSAEASPATAPDTDAPMFGALDAVEV